MGLHNLAKMTTTTTGTGTLTLGSADTGFLSFAGAGVVDGEQLTFTIENGNDKEVSRGVYASSGTTLTRTLILSTTGSLLSLSGTSKVYITAPAESLQWNLIGTSTPTSGSSVDFTSIPTTYNDLMLEFSSIKNSGGTSILTQLAVSEDNSTFSSLVSLGPSGTALQHGIVTLPRFAGSGKHPVHSINWAATPGTRPTLNTVLSSQHLAFIIDTNGIQALRLAISSGSFAAGSGTVNLWGR